MTNITEVYKALPTWSTGLVLVDKRRGFHPGDEASSFSKTAQLV
jgi:hypothetical protein